MKHNDPIGAAMEDYLTGNYSAEIIVKSNITEDSEIPVEYLFRSEDEMPAIEKKALQLCRGKVLDVGAATGCHSIVLQKRGLDIHPIDISEKAVEIMKNRGLSKAKQADYFLFKGEKYDTLLFLMNGIGICGKLENLDRFFEKAKEILNPGGQILLDSSDIIYMYETEDGSIEIDLNAGYYGEVEYQMIYKKISGPKFNWLFVDFDILSQHAILSGFNCEKIMEGEHYDYLARLFRI